MIFIDENKKRTKVHSNYWLSDWADDKSITGFMSDKEKSSYDTYKLAASKRAISNFVNIVTNQVIPVTFNTRGESYTDGKSVVIGAEVVNPKDFDVAVGLALHEGSHIKLSDFDLLRKINSLIPQSDTDNGEAVGIWNVSSTIKDLWNYVEDRRIDFFVYDSAPGYREYYRSMYDKYFNSPVIDQALKSDDKRDETLNDYFFRIINLHNPNRDLTALKGLKEIYKVIDLNKISRLKNSKDAFDVALEVYRIIVKNLDVVKQEEATKKAEEEAKQSQPQSGDDGQGGDDEPTTVTDEEFQDILDNTDFSDDDDDDSKDDSKDDSTDGDSKGGDSDDDADEDGESGSATGDEKAPKGGGDSTDDSKDGDSDDEGEDGDSKDGTAKGGSDSNGGGGSADGDADDSTEETKTVTKKILLTPRQKDLLEKKIEQQKKFMDGDVKKKTITKTENKSVKGIEESGSEITAVGEGVESRYGYNQKGVQCIVVKKLTQSLLESSVFPMSRTDWNGNLEKYNESAVADGIRIGTSLGKKLQVRSEDRTTVFNRQKIGKIDKRMISSLGFGNENVFQFNDVDTYNNANLHVSIDASGSMSGSKWQKTITNVVAMCKAVDMIAGLEIQVTFRTTNSSIPYIVLAYDSKVDKFSKVRKVFPLLKVAGTTPEGLCFEAIMKQFLASTNDMDSYFINISDGEPYFEGNGFYYGGTEAHNHTRKMIKKMEGMGIKTLSYFVSSWSADTVSQGFKTMYGKGARAIDVTNLSQIVKTVNKMFMDK